MASTKKAPKAPPTAPRRFRRLAWSCAIVVGIVVILGGGVVATQASARDRTLPGLRVAGRPAGMQTRDALEQQLQKQVDEYQAKGFVFTVGDKQATITPTVSAADDPDLTYELVTFDVGATVEQAFAYGRSGQWYRGAAQTITAWLGQASVPLDAAVNDDQMAGVLQKNFGQNDEPTVPTTFVEEGGSIVVHAGRQGTVLNYHSAITQLLADLRNGRALSTDNELVNYVLVAEPDVVPASAAVAQSLLPQVTPLLENAPLTVTANSKEFSIDRPTLLSWLTVDTRSKTPTLALDAAAVAEKIEAIAGEVDVAAKEGKFALENGRVKEFQVGAQGWELDRAAAVQALAIKVIAGEKAIALTGREVEPQTATADTGDLGIKEIIGVGKSNFSGSPVNRRHNIAVGAATLNGILIKPGEEFSLVKTLGKIDASTGYRSELVIKGNKTTPEFGGGLCQIGTTTFRAALDSGLPILERQNHSYRVRYYEPAGTDATIYDPKPDFRFINDTGHYILIQTRINGDDLTFEFWGTKDGRKIERTTPKISNVVAPPPMKNVETTDLKPGEKKCTELAHNGADAVFTYTVTYPDGTVKSQVFKSHYKPWQAVCLVGVEKKKVAPSETPVPDASTNAPIENININDSI